MIELKYIITGTGRCGTVYLAKVLTSVGIHCGHESIFDYHDIDYALAKLKGQIPIETSEVSQQRFKDGVNYALPSWFRENEIVAESSYMAAPYLDHECLQNAKIIHVVRNPIKVIHSFTNYLGYFQNRHPAVWCGPKLYETFIFSHCSDLFFDMSQYERAALFYIKWNQMIEKQIQDREHLFHRVEDSLDQIFHWLDVKPSNWFNDKTANTFEKPTEDKFTLNKLPNGLIKDQLIDMGRRYGYSMGAESEYFLT